MTPSGEARKHFDDNDQIYENEMINNDVFVAGNNNK